MAINKVLAQWRGAALRKMIELVENVDGSMDILMDGDGVTAGNPLPKFAWGLIASAVWVRIPSIFRLRFTGSGIATMDARDSLGNITTAVATYTITSATDQIEFPYAGDDAVSIRVTLTGTLTCEVI